MDTGPLFLQEKVRVETEDDAITLKKKLIEAGLTGLNKLMAELSQGLVKKEPQKGEVSHAPRLKKEDGRINWTQGAKEIFNLVRGVIEWPGAYTFYRSSESGSKQLKISKVEIVDFVRKGKAPGEIVTVEKNEGIVVQTGQGQLLLKEVQPEGKKPMDAWSFWQGARLNVGDKFI